MDQPPLDPRAVRMLARHFGHLQGRKLVAVGVFLQVLAEAWVLTASEEWTVAAGAVGLVALGVVVSSLDAQYAAPRIWAVATALMFGGLLDHHLFVRLMRGRTIAAEAAR
jgi:hypothetical protein